MVFANNNSNKKVVKTIHFPELKFIGNATDSSTFSLPFSKAGNLILIKAKADSTEGNFVLDTGCPGLVLNLTYFRDYPRTQDADEDGKGITGSIAAIEHTTIADFSFGGKKEINIKADLVNLGHIENSKQVKILGLIGIGFLHDCELIIDYENNLLLFHVAHKKETKNYQSKFVSDTTKCSIIPFEIFDSRIIIKTDVEGKKLKLLIDCAAEVNVLDSRLPGSFFDNFSVLGKITLRGAGISKVEAVKGELKEFNVAKKKLINMPFIVTNLEKTCFSYGGCVDGVLGFDFLSLQKVGFNFITNKLYLWN